MPAQLTLLGRARLPGWRLAFDLFSVGGETLAADILPSEGSEVWGALYELPLELVCRSDGARSVLDRIEGHRATSNPENYVPVRVTVEHGEDPLEAWTYVGCNEARERCAREHADARLTPEYVKSILDGACALRLPAVYCKQLKTLTGR